MFTHNARLGIIEHDELDGFVDPPIPKTAWDRVGNASMPEATAMSDGIRGCLGVQADAEGGGVDCLKDCFVLRV